ncbi:MAG: hypothetical protein WBF71_01510 [Microthrixaceae bacterium]
MKHELWMDEGMPSFCLSGPMGDDQRALHSDRAELVWTVEAASHFDAMTLFYEHMGWGVYSTDYPEIDRETYACRGSE